MKLSFAGPAAALAVLALAGDASAFCLSSTCRSTSKKECQTDEDGCPAEGAKLSWPTTCISWAMNRLGTQDLDPADTRMILRKAFQVWVELPCKGGGSSTLTFQEREPIACKKSEYNKEGANVNIVLFQDDDWNYRGIDGTLAKTSVTYNDQTGEIYDADIELNAASNTVTITDDPAEVQYDLQAVMTHEIGHFIGLAHSPEPAAVMFASYSPGSTSQRALTEDDVAAVCAVYPPNSGAPCNVEPRGGFGATCETQETKGLCAATASPAAGGGGASVAIAGAGLIALARARRREGARRGRV